MWRKLLQLYVFKFRAVVSGAVCMFAREILINFPYLSHNFSFFRPKKAHRKKNYYSRFAAPEILLKKNKNINIIYLLLNWAKSPTSNNKFTQFGRKAIGLGVNGMKWLILVLNRMGGWEWATLPSRSRIQKINIKKKKLHLQCFNLFEFSYIFLNIIIIIFVYLSSIYDLFNSSNIKFLTFCLLPSIFVPLKVSKHKNDHKNNLKKIQIKLNKKNGKEQKKITTWHKIYWMAIKEINIPRFICF